MTLFFPRAAFLLVAALAPLTASAADIPVADADALEQALAAAQPGDVLIMTDGVWRDQEIAFAAQGTAEAPITLRPETPGGVTITGASNLSISGSHLVVDGLNFEDGTPGDLSHVIQFRGPLGDATHCRLTNTRLANYNPEHVDTRYFWVSLYGTHNRVDHCRFDGQNHSGCTVVAWLDGVPTHHRIDHNHLLNRPRDPEDRNGFETMRLGTSKQGHTAAHVTVENNLFERCDGEIEIISNKSCDNVFRGNTFRDCAGTLTLRHGHRAVIENNAFLGENKKGSGGIRVIGEGHQVTGNYIADVDDRAEGAISIAAGIPNTKPNGYQQVKDLVISHNTIVKPAGAAIRFDWGVGTRKRSLLPERVLLHDNVFVTVDEPLFEGNQGADWTWQRNVVYVPSLGMPRRDGVATVNPKLKAGANGLWQPAANGPAAGLGAANVKPLSRKEVGPDWDTTAAAR